jgi:hypothetical protein
MPKAIVIQDGEHGTAELVEMDTELETLQGAVGGFIEAADLGEVVFIMDEEGKLKDKPLNARATLYFYEVISPTRSTDYLAGTVVLFGGRGGDDLADVPQSAIEHFDLG